MSETSMSVVNKATVRRFLEEAFGQGKLEVVDEVLDPDFVCHDPNSETGEIRGADTVKGEVGYFHNAFPDFRWTVEDQVAEGDKVTTRYTLSGTHEGEFFGVPASGRRGEVSGINIDRFEGGKLVEEWPATTCWGRCVRWAPSPSQGKRTPEQQKGSRKKRRG